MQDELFVTSDGSHTILSSRYGESYHSRFGAIQESRHVFIESAFRFKSIQQKQLSVLEMGFGTGLNALLTMEEAWRNNVRVDYCTVEAYPISSEQARQLNFIEVLNLPALKEAFLQMHDAPWGVSIPVLENFTFSKWNVLFEEFDTESKFDVIYFDAFAPNTQPELWEVPLLEKMFRMLHPGGILTTYSAKGSVKRNLKAIGFTLESLEGPPGKREMTRAHKAL